MVHCAWESGDDRGLFCRLYKNRGTGKRAYDRAYCADRVGETVPGPFSQREQAMDRLAGRMVCKHTAYTDADSPALCGDPVRIQGKGDGGYSEKCIVDDPGMLSGMAERQFMDDMCSLSYLSGCTCSGSLPRMVSVEKKAGARWDRGFCRGASVSGGVLLLVFRRGL